jgi:hypothetical protein
MRRILVAALWLGCGVGLLTAAPKLTPEQLVKLHLDGVGPPPTAEQSRDLRGVCATTSPAKSAGQLAGPFRFTSSARSSRWTLQFKSDLYEGENFSVESDQVDVGFAQPRTSSRSAMGSFVAQNRVILSEGLFGGVLNARWPLFSVAARQAKLSYDGLKKFAGRDLHRLRYRAKDKQGNLDVHLYFEPDTYRHVGSVYSTSQTQSMGLTPESSSQQSDQYFRLEEQFLDFVQVGAQTLPKTWNVRYERSGNTASEWKYEMRLQSVDEKPVPAGMARGIPATLGTAGSPQ